jgi:hypothetical protein
MSEPAILISEASHQMLKDLSEKTGLTMTNLLAKALEAYHRKLFFERMNDGYAELRADPEAWAEHLAERKQWETTMMDGLNPDEKWTEDGRCVTPEKEKP